MDNSVPVKNYDAHLPRIRCAKCDKPVDRVVAIHEQLEDELVLRAYCHGDVDEMRLDYRTFTKQMTEAIAHLEGVAFMPKAIMQTHNLAPKQ